jgi:hypothetical protein
MINGVSSSQNEYTLIANGVEKNKNAINGESERSDEKNLGYKLSLSDENWSILGSKNEKEDDKDKNDLSEEDLRKIEELKKIDKKVHAHEQAHLSAAGGYARSGANYDYVTGPDGNRYANAGHVNLDVGKEKTPEATIKKANVIQKAALAPADPSPADRQIAANAAKMASDAQKEIAERGMAESKNTNTENNANAKFSQDTSDEPQAMVKKAS